MISRYGGLDGFRDEASARYTFTAASTKLFCDFEEDPPYIYSFPSQMAAVYLFFGIQDHVFNDANNRTSLAATLLFLLLNNLRLSATDKELVELVVRVASGDIGKDGLRVIIGAKLRPQDTVFTNEQALDYILYYYDDVFKELSHS